MLACTVLVPGGPTQGFIKIIRLTLLFIVIIILGKCSKMAVFILGKCNFVCPKCKIGLGEKKLKFCPECGFDLKV